MEEITPLDQSIINEIASQKIGTVKKTKLTIFEYCLVKSIIRKADISITDGRSKLITTNNKIYIIALNYKNALMKLQRKKVWFHTLKNNK